ncbi:MAG: hypothetical protein IPN85_18965 [Flavobacteriales bacterium]|nr:hypothetical protein [Flavobacteriales bacterium]
MTASNAITDNVLPNVSDPTVKFYSIAYTKPHLVHLDEQLEGHERLHP